MKYSCLVYSEGGRDKRFLMALIDLAKFKYYTKNWFFTYENASGSSPEIILKQCQKFISGNDYHLVLCFIDLDKLKSDYPKTWVKEKQKLEKKFSKFKIIWQIENAEDEYRRVIGEHCKKKCKLNKIARKKVVEFINSEFWKKILKPITELEKKLKEELSEDNEL